jgi:hypothetical protein
MLTFTAANVAPMPKLICVGSVSQVLEGKVSQTGSYVVQPIQIAAYGTGRDARYNLLYKPEWFTPGFDPQSYYEGIEEGDDEAVRQANSIVSVYRRNINVRSGISALRGMAGSEEAFNTLANRVLSLDEITIEAVTEVLSNFFANDNEGVMFGYVLKQQHTKTDDIDPETGKNVWVPENRYEVDRFFDYSEKAIEGYKRQAEKSAGGVIVTFDSELGY